MTKKVTLIDRAMHLIGFHPWKRCYEGDWAFTKCLICGKTWDHKRLYEPGFIDKITKIEKEHKETEPICQDCHKETLGVKWVSLELYGLPIALCPNCMKRYKDWNGEWLIK